ncbi:hypothetical protein CFRA_10610 [Corynebacterium frankenforstense DSM 45800]|uniref:Uncharacterized protein n=1 Tax=Corynebacterium frankenforstense DSM 45800 TaxID=1437875 RepID=A0A1L7CUU1_9CORY|nr:hypothetical protein [Corynebacterium frankenforstense]APT89603.1 hypothetical protein CFRA_10610 [Corynebacterium frankenforstense DSM 45800]
MATPRPGAFNFRNQGPAPKPGEQAGQPGTKPGDTTKPGGQPGTKPVNEPGGTTKPSDGNYKPNTPDLSSLGSSGETGKVLGIIFGLLSLFIPIAAWLMNSGLL